MTQPAAQTPAHLADVQAIEVAEAAARTESVSKIYGSGDTRVIAVDEITVQIPRGRFTAIMGPSGSGKSTLMQCMDGLDTASSGQVYVGEVELSSLEDKSFERMG